VNASFAKAHAGFASSCDWNTPIVLRAEAAIADIRGPFVTRRVENDHAMIDRSCGLN